MEEITLNGFEVFEDFLPGANVPKKKHSRLNRKKKLLIRIQMLLEKN